MQETEEASGSQESKAIDDLTACFEELLQDQDVHEEEMDPPEMEEAPQSQKQVAEIENICLLDEYCLLEIFNYINLRDSLTCSKVCTRWAEVIRRNWRSIRSLKASMIKTALDMSLEDAEILFSECCPNAVEISIPPCKPKHLMTLLSHIVDKSVNLKRLMIKDMELGFIQVESLSKIFMRMSDSMEIQDWIQVISSAPFFEGTSCMHKVHCQKFFVQLAGVSLKSLFFKSRKISEKECGLLMKMKFLKSMNYNLLNAMLGRSVLEAKEPKPTDTTYTFTCPYYATHSDLYYLRWLEQLLNGSVCIHDGSLSFFELCVRFTDASNTALRVNIAVVGRKRVPAKFSKEMKELIIQSLTESIFLNNLSLEHCLYVKDEFLYCIAKKQGLNVLRFFHCHFITDNGIERILRTSPSLQILDVRFCDQLTDAIAHTALAVIDSHLRTTTLTLYIEGTGITMDTVLQCRHPRLVFQF
ncbi:F-box and leucine-rich repeat protein 13-like [Periplaneta americana]|uniref:F-box and leucine-rich repeat protein 13-like n=1 Tax=Periplaneta americana TaxID=6978 RepID=UPI0037E95B43